MLRLRTLGGLSLDREGVPLDSFAGQRKALALLALLPAGGNGGVSRDKVLAYLWPESDEERARNALNQLLFTLRRQLNAATLFVGSSELKLNPEVITSDVAQFECALAAGNLEGAVAAYGGSFLDGIYLKDLAEFERWVERERQRLAHSYHAALERLARGAEERQEYTAAVQWWRQLAAVDPLSARIARAYMEALAATGDREAAIRHGRVHAELTRAELDAEPDPALLTFAEQLRAGTAGTGAGNGSTDVVNGVAKSAAATEPAPLVLSVPKAPDGPAPSAEASPDGRAATRRTRPRVRRLHLAVAGLTATAVAATILALRPRAEPTVVLVPPFENATGDTALGVVSRMAADWVAQGLARTGLVQVLDLRTALRIAPASASDSARERAIRKSGASVIVQGIIYRQRDSLSVQTRLVSARDGKMLLEVDPVAGQVADPRAVVESVRQRIMGGFAALSDTRFEPWAKAVSQPPRYDAYQEFVAGLENLVLDQFKAAHMHFLAAARLDTSFVQAKLFVLDNEAYEGGYAFRDSLLRAALAQRDRLSPYDRASLDRAVALHRGDPAGVLVASRRLTALAPRATDALVRHAVAAVATNRFAEAQRVLHGAGPPDDWGRDGRQYWVWDTWAHHLMGDFEGELAEGARARASLSNRGGGCAYRLRPLAALGREATIDSLIAVCQDGPGVRPAGVIYFQMGLEYRAHGHHDAARRAFDRARRWYASQQPPWKEPLMIIDWNLGNWPGVRDYWREKMAAGPLQGDVASGYAQLGVASAHLGDSATALAMSARIAALNDPESRATDKMWRSMILGALGDRDGAVRLLQEAIDEGIWPAVFLHQQPGVASLRGYAPFEALLRPRGR